MKSNVTVVVAILFPLFFHEFIPTVER